MLKIYDTVIIGGGPAGYTAALYSARSGLSTLVLEKLSPGGQMTFTDVIDNYPGFDEGIDGFELGLRMQRGAEKFGAETEYAQVTEVDFSSDVKLITTTSGEIQAHTVIIATGARPKELGIRGESELYGRGVHYCAHCDGRFYKDKTVAIAGGGNTAVSDALYLSRLCKRVYLIHRRDSFRADKIYLDALSKAENVEILKSSVVSEIFTKEQGISEIAVRSTKNNDETILAVDGLFVSIGRTPETELFKESLLLDENGYIVTDEETRTSIEGVFAAGDVRTKELRQVITAAADGAVAAHLASEYINSYQKRD